MNNAAIISAFAVIVGALIGVYTSLLHRIARLEDRVTRLQTLDRKWWEWAQQVIALYRKWCHPDAPDLPPIPTEQVADQS
ncbi:MAG TPA: hypothetical protein VGC04_11235 [Cellulomonas sp.]